MTREYVTVKARTNRLIFRGLAAESAVESAYSIPESANSTSDSVIFGQLSVLNMFNILNPLESADGKRPTIAVVRRQISLVGMALKPTLSADRPVVSYQSWTPTGHLVSLHTTRPIHYTTRLCWDGHIPRFSLPGG